MRNFLYLSLFLLVLSLQISSAFAHDDNIYMGAPVELGTLPNGVVMNAEQLKGSLGSLEKKTYKVADGIWAILGQSIVHVYVIEGKEGLIVYDTGISAREGEAVLAEIRTFSDKPINTIIYSHGHYSYGASPLAEGKPVMVIGHPAINQQATTGGQGGAFEELRSVMTSRGTQQMGMMLPATGPDANAGERIVGGEMGFLPVNHEAQDGEKIVVDGIAMEFFTSHVSDAPSLTVWLPERKAALNNFYWPVAANLFPARGDEFRDVRSWMGGVQVIRDLHPEIMLSTHALPVLGEQNIQQTLQHYLDYHAFVLDQSLRGILKGLSGEELREFVKVPEIYKDITQNYGETTNWYPLAIYQRGLGWFSGDAADLNRVSPQFRAEQLVSMLGGADKVLDTAKNVTDKQQWAWALELVNYVYKADPSNARARVMKAELLRKHAELTPASIAHNFYMAQSMALEGKVKIPVRIYFDQLLEATNPCTLIDQYRVRIVPERTKDQSGLIAFDFGDNQRCGLYVRPGIAEYIADLSNTETKPVATLHLSQSNLVTLYRGDVGLAELVNDKNIKVTGNRKQAESLGGAFEVMPSNEILFGL